MPMRRWSIFDFLSPLLTILNKKQKFRILGLLIFQFLSGILELIGIFIVGFISILCLAILNNSEPKYSGAFLIGLNSLNLESFKSEYLIIAAAIIVVLFFAIKNLFILWMNNYLQNYLSWIAVNKSIELFDMTFAQNQIEPNFKSSEDTVYSATEGSVYGVIGLLWSIITMIAEGLSLVMLLFVLLIFNIQTTILMTVIYCSYFLLLSKYLGVKVSSNARNYQTDNENSRILFTDLQNVQRELFVSGKIIDYRYKFYEFRKSASSTYGKMIFFQSIPRATLDFLIILSIFLISSFAVLTSDLNGAITQILVFLTAISRIAPSALRLQQAKMTAKASYSQAGKFFELLDKKIISQPLYQDIQNLKPSEDLKISAKNVSYTHSGANNPILNDISFEINQGDFVAIVGKSGAGKSTLCDLVLGINEPSDGEIRINNVPPRNFIRSNPGLISFVPQKVSLIHASFLENLTFSSNRSPGFEVNDLVRQTNLEKFLLSDWQSGAEIQSYFQGSGGEIQRIGLARALFTSPKILILDEPTSSQDQLNVDLFNKVLVSLLEKKVSVIVVAHNRDIIKKADFILYLDEMTGLKQGNFSSLSETSQSFNKLTNTPRF